MLLVTVIALVIVFAKIKVVEAIQVNCKSELFILKDLFKIQGTPDPRISTFKPLRQRVETDIMYVGIGFQPEDWYFYHSKVVHGKALLCQCSVIYQGKMSDRAYKSIRILDTLRWTGPTDPPTMTLTPATQ